MQLSHYIALTSQYEANRRIRHDILHHVNTIRYLLENGQQQEAAEYARQFLDENQRSSQLGQCDNPVIDAFLYGRVQEAKAQGITVETHIILPVELPVSNSDLVIVFGNLMDNAVEACAKLENPKIELNAHIEKGIWSSRNPIPLYLNRRDANSAAFQSWARRGNADLEVSRRKVPGQLYERNRKW